MSHADRAMQRFDESVGILPPLNEDVAALQVEPLTPGVFRMAVSLLWVLFLLWIAVVTWARYYGVNPDGFAYIGIARLIKLGAWHDAVNAYLGPLISWLLALLSLFVPELLASRLIVASASVVVALVSWFILKESLQNKTLRYIAAVTIMLAPAMIDTTALITPDLLLSIFVLLAFYYGMKFLERAEYKSAALAGLSWGLAYYAKSFGFVFAPIFFMLLWLLAVLPFERRRLMIVSKPLILGLSVFVIVSMPWLTALHYKYGHWMSGSAGKYNLFYQYHGIYPQKPRPIPPDAPWLNPQLFARDNNMAGYWDPCPPGDIIYSYSLADLNPFLQLKTFLTNLCLLLPAGLWGMFGLGCLPIIIGLVLCLPTLKAEKPMLLIALGCLFWVLMYLAVILEYRYLTPVVPLLVLLACKGYYAAFLKLAQNPSAPGTNCKLRLLHILLLIQVITTLIWGGSRVIHYVIRNQQLTSKQVQLAYDLARVDGVTNLAQTYSCKVTGCCLAYIANIRYAGQIVPERHKGALLYVLRKGNISHLITRAGEIDEAHLAGLQFVRDFSAEHKEYSLYKVLYDD